ncbi:hypothetical protein BF702P1_00031 [Bacteroides phage BF702P1]|jgi:uncharacterized protein YlzI (FlbEa/FlbD family)|nr:hypothetical protein BF702P1_00031 [Bacteroides phage BF702P1]
MKLVKFELISGKEIMINPKSIESIVRYTDDFSYINVIGADKPYMVKGSIEDVNKALSEGSKIDSIAGLMVIVFIGIYILSTLANLLS